MVFTCTPLIPAVQSSSCDRGLGIIRQQYCRVGQAARKPPTHTNERGSIHSGAVQVAWLSKRPFYIREGGQTLRTSAAADAVTKCDLSAKSMDFPQSFCHAPPRPTAEAGRISCQRTPSMWAGMTRRNRSLPINRAFARRSPGPWDKTRRA